MFGTPVDAFLDELPGFFGFGLQCSSLGFLYHLRCGYLVLEAAVVDAEYLLGFGGSVAEYGNVACGQCQLSVDDVDVAFVNLWLDVVGADAAGDDEEVSFLNGCYLLLHCEGGCLVDISRMRMPCTLSMSFRLMRYTSVRIPLVSSTTRLPSASL